MRSQEIADDVHIETDDNNSNLEKSNFYQSRAPREAHLSQSGLSLLEAVIAALDSRQLSSTSISLDVIATLMRKRV